MSYRSDSQAIQKTPDGLAEKIQILGAFLIHPEERAFLLDNPSILETLTRYLQPEDHADLEKVIGTEIPLPTSSRLTCGKAGLMVKIREARIHQWARDGKPEMESTPQGEDQGDKTPWTVTTTEYGGKHNWVYLTNTIDGRTLLIHKSAFITGWSPMKPTGRTAPYPAQPGPPDKTGDITYPISPP